MLHYYNINIDHRIKYLRFLYETFKNINYLKLPDTLFESIKKKYNNIDIIECLDHKDIFLFALRNEIFYNSRYILKNKIVNICEYSAKYNNLKILLKNCTLNKILDYIADDLYYEIGISINEDVDNNLFKKKRVTTEKNDDEMIAINEALQRFKLND